MRPLTAFFADVRKFWSAKELLPVIGVAVSGLVVVALAFPFIPGWLFVLGSVLLVLGTVIALRNGARLAYLEEENTFHSSRLKRVIENMHEGVIVYSPQFTIQGINRAALAMFHLPDAMVGKTVTPQQATDKTLGLLATVIYPSLASNVQQLSSDDWPQVLRIEAPAPAREFVTVTDRVTNRAGAVAGFIKIIQDKTREREIAASKSEFISTTAHELRTPLTGITWVFESLQGSVKDADAARLVSQGAGLATRGLKLVNSMLDVAQIEEGKVQYHREPFDLAALVQDVVADVQPLADKYGISIAFSKPEPLSVTGDERRIRAAFEAVLDNAVTYNTKNGSVTVRIAREGEQAHLTVQDTGIGISEADQRNIFDKFTRGAQAEHIDPNGSGLGLYFAKSVIEAHRGKIWVESIVGRGSTFHVTLPVS